MPVPLLVVPVGLKVGAVALAAAKGAGGIKLAALVGAKLGTTAKVAAAGKAATSGAMGFKLASCQDALSVVSAKAASCGQVLDQAGEHTRTCGQLLTEVVPVPAFPPPPPPPLSTIMGAAPPPPPPPTGGVPPIPNSGPDGSHGIAMMTTERCREGLSNAHLALLLTASNVTSFLVGRRSARKSGDTRH